MMLRSLGKNRKKGFTLVEVIVVLIIIAVLAAISIPALTGYINSASEKTIVSEARSVQMAMQELLSEKYGSGHPIEWTNANGGTTVEDGVTIASYVMKLAGQDYIPSDITYISTSGTTLATFVYKKDNAYAGYNAFRTPKYKIATSPDEAIAD